MLRAAQQGQREVWADLYPVLRDRLPLVFRGRGIDKSAFDDLTSLVILAILEQFQRGFEPDKSLTKWVFGIARNQARLLLRRRSYSSELRRRLEKAPRESTAGPSTLLRNADLHALAMGELPALPPKYRVALQSQLADEDASALAEREHIQQVSARTRLRRAKDKLRDRIHAKVGSSPLRNA